MSCISCMSHPESVATHYIVEANVICPICADCVKHAPAFGLTPKGMPR